MTAPRFVVGIDLGTTNCAIAYADTGVGETDAAEVSSLSVPQLVQAGSVADRPLLPSFLYLPGPSELPAGSLKLPWDANRDYAVGEFARTQGAMVPTRLVSSAKSWLCHAGIDRRAPVLPWKSPEGSRRVSPLEASTAYLKHLCEAWNAKMAADAPGSRLEFQEVILTVPASFDAVARELTAEAARAAGLEHVTLLEEPQAAFYAWIAGHREAWREQVQVGDAVLVCDIGGGTTDLTLIAVSEEQGQLVLTRVAVGDHILLGGDNMDLALAHVAAQALTAKGSKLDAGQMQMLWHASRGAKEALFGDANLAAAPVTVLGRGSRVVGGALKTELQRADVESTLLEGFFPACKADAEPQRGRATGFQELGLPYAHDPAITRHLAHFLHRQADALTEKGASRLTAVLFNGGVCKATQVRERILDQLNSWGGKKKPVRELPSQDLDLAVANGAAYYGLARRGKGVRIRGGTARAYYVGIESSMPAVPGARPPLKAFCVLPLGTEEGSEVDLPAQEFGLVVGEPAEFRFLASNVRRNDTAGLLVEEWDDDIEELSPLATTLEAAGREGQTVPVHLHARVTEVGTLELSCHSRDQKDRWKLEFNVREQRDV